MALEQFGEATRTWFNASFGAPTAAQAGAWDAIIAKENSLVIAPTGSGKTLAAFLASIDQLMSAPADRAPGTSVLYISPLKALGVDIERNLRSPLVGIGHTAHRLGQKPAEITVGVRTGDTTAKQRRDLVRNPPDILITTPESLYLMLTSQARSTLSQVSTVIVDEIHALAGTKRGAHLAVSLERLDTLRHSAGVTQPAQRIGLSATVEPPTEVAQFLGGNQQVTIVAPPAEKRWDITVSVPVPDLAAPDAHEDSDEDQPLHPSIWPHVEHKIVELIQANRSTIVFVNSRRLAEKLTGRIQEITQTGSHLDPERNTETDDAKPALARAHHGSVSKEQRKLIEEDLKAGRLRCVVATSSLELGIDMGAVDLVIQVESPHAVSAGLQRIGRAGHQVGEVSVGWFFPKHRGDLLSTSVVVQRMLGARIEPIHTPQNPLDILAQQTVAAAAIETLDVEEWFQTLRRCAPFASLPRSAYEATLDLLAGKYPSDRFAELRPRIIWDRDAGTITGRPGAQRLAVTSGGTIPDRGLFGVYLIGAENSRTGGRRVGELDEEMVYESRVGDVFALGATSWRIEDITFDRVLVSPAFGQPGSLPFWRGDGIGRPAELGEAIGEFTAELLTLGTEDAHDRLIPLGLDTWARENLIRYLEDQHQATGAVPDHRTLVVERTRDELGDWRIILHSPYGMRVHAPWALAVGERLHQRYGLDGAAFASDDGMVLRVPMMDEEPPGAELFRFDAAELEEIVTAQVSASALFAARFRETSARALLLPRQNPGQRTPLWQQRQRASQLLEVAAGYPSFPLIMESMREVLQDVYDLPALQKLTTGITQRRIRLVESTTSTPSPFAQSMLFGYIAQYLYEGDSPLAERRAAALSVDPQLLNELLGRVELRDFLDAEVIAQVVSYAQRLSASRRLKGVEGAADLLRLIGPLTPEELAARLQPEPAEQEGSELTGPSGTGHVRRHPARDSPISMESRPPEPVTEHSSQPAPSEDGEPDHEPPLSPLVAEQYAEDLVATHRAFRLTWQGEPRYAAVEDAARLRDGLGVPIPPGIPHTFLEPVEDPLADLVLRYARTHAPFTDQELSTALGLPVAATQQTLTRLRADGLVVEGLFRPDRETPVQAEYCETQLLARIRRQSLAALRSAVEPVPEVVYAQFLSEWQSLTPGTVLRGTTGVAEALTQLAGSPAPASAWESFILPARVTDYQPGMLDELITSGQVIATGHGELSGHDGWVSFTPAEDAELLTTSATEPSALHQQILQVLHRGGAWFPEAIVQTLSTEAENTKTAEDHDLVPISHAPTISNVQDALWEMFWGGQVVPDSFAPVRARLAGGSTAHRRKPKATSTRHSSRRMRLRAAVQQHRAAAQSGNAGVGGTGGRWSLHPHIDTAAPTADPTQAAYARAEILLDRYGVLTRGSVAAEQVPGGFAAMYKVLTAAEEAGHIRRGYFIEHLGAAQFTTSTTVDRLREIAEELQEKPARQALVLAATDPANPYGAALDWPSQEHLKARPGRKAGALVILHAGELVLYMERGGRTLLLYTEDQDQMTAAANALTSRLRTANTGRIAVERVNGEPILAHQLAEALKTAGFRSSPSGLRLSA